MSGPARQPALLLLALLALLVTARPAPAGNGELSRLENEFKDAIEKVSGATVGCVNKQSVSSGVIVSRSGLVLSDGDAGIEMGRPPRWLDSVEVRVPDAKSGTFRAYTAKLVLRRRDTDSSLWQIEDGPATGFSTYLEPASSDELRVGAFTFVMGNAFSTGEGSPSLTAGVLSHLELLPDGDPGGRLEYFYTSAAVNPGVNGGPVVDSAGRLIGTVSTWATAANPQDPCQFLGRVIPIDRLRPLYADLPAAKNLFPRREPRGTRSQESQALETVLHLTGQASRGALVSLDVRRTNAVSASVPGPRGPVEVRRYQGPVCGTLVSEDGLIVTSLYNLTNITELMYSQWTRNPASVRLVHGLSEIESVRACFADGRDYAAELISHHEGLGIALLKADLSEAAGATGVARKPLPEAPPEAFVQGAFTLGLGNPFGKRGCDDPLLTFGILSKLHGDVDDPWRETWQTDAGVTDGNCGGAAVDIEGRLLGILTMWTATGHGRNSGVGFIVPWPAVKAVLPRMAKGESFRIGALGITWDGVPGSAPEFTSVRPDSAADKAGFAKGDVITRIDDQDVSDIGACISILRRRYAGETVHITVRRGEQALAADVLLQDRD